MSQKSLQKRMKAFPPSVVAELDTLERDLGGRQALVGMLTLSPLTPSLRYVLGILGTRTSQEQSLAHICATSGMLPGELLHLLTSAAMLRGKARAAVAIGNRVADVAEDVMKKAAPYEEACGPCQGTGTRVADPTPAVPNPEPEPCQTCRGSGRLIYQPDLETQKLALDLAQMLPKSAGVQVQNIAPGGHGAQQQQNGGLGVFAQLSALSDRILYGSGAKATADLDDETEMAPVEGQVVPPAAEP